MTTTSAWTEEIQIPEYICDLDKGVLSKPVMIDCERMFLAKLGCTGDDQLLIYNTRTSQWKLIKTLANNNTMRECGSAIDTERQSIYFMSCDRDKTVPSINIYDIKSNICLDPIPVEISKNNYGFGLQVIDHKLHIILGGNNDKHYIIDIEKKECGELHRFDEYPKRLGHSGLIYMKNKAQLWLLGGVDFDIISTVRDIFIYSTKCNEWKLLDIKLPDSLKLFGHICTNDERYIVILGGHHFLKEAKITVIDTKLLKVTTSSIECPINEHFHACLVDNTKQSELIVNGFINKCWKQDKWIDDAMMRYPSNDIISLIHRFHYEQIIHLFTRIGMIRHWFISLNNVLQSCEL